MATRKNEDKLKENGENFLTKVLGETIPKKIQQLSSSNSDILKNITDHESDSDSDFFN